LRAASAREIATTWRLGKLQQASSDDLVLVSTDPASAQFVGLRLVR
jgi:hypothetical protein